MALGPGVSAIQLLAAAVERRIRAGAGLISLEHFPRPDYRMMAALVHPGRLRQAPGPRRGRP
jgi:hypothetical protein